MTNSPLDQFEVNSLFSISFPVMNFGLYLTNLGLYLIIASIILVLIFVFSFSRKLASENDSSSLVPSSWGVSTESIYASVQGMVKDQIGDAQTQYLPLAVSIFTFILVANLAGNIPYSLSIFSSAILTMYLSVTIFLSVTVLGLVIHRVHWFAYFVPAGTPLALAPLLVLIETISYLARAVSLGVRIFSNLVAGKVLAYIVSSGIYGFFSKGILISILALIPVVIFVALLGLELAVALIQSYVFTILTCSYIADSIKLH